MTEHEHSLSAALYGVFPKHRGIEQDAEQPQADPHAAEDAAFARIENRAASKAATQRLVRARAALLDAVETMRHGQSYDAEERAALVDGVIANLGGGLDATQRQQVKALINKAASEIEDGSKIEALRAVDETAEALANGSGKIGQPTAVKPGDDTDDPGALAALIAR
jgi:hypothetical protein